VCSVRDGLHRVLWLALCTMDWPLERFLIVY